MRQTNYFKRWLALLVATLIVILVVPGVTQAQTADTPQIHLQYASFDPLSGEPYVPSEQKMSAASIETGTYLLQFSGPVREEWKTAVTEAGVRLYDYVPDYAFIARMDAAQASRVLELPYVRWVGLYHPAYRFSPALKEMRLTTDDEALVLLNVQTLPDHAQGRLVNQVELMGGSVINHSADDLSAYARVLLPAGQIEALTAQDGILWVEPYVEPVLSNDVGGASILQASTIHASLGLYGNGQIVGISDSGLDVGTTGAEMSDDFEGRIVEGQAMCATYYTKSDDKRTSWSDLHTHGTHVSGSVLGNGILSGSNPGSHDYSGSYAGLAPEARLVIQSLDSDGDGGLECIPGDLSTQLFAPAYNLGARIHSNSWGGPSGTANPFGVYTEQSRQVDSAAWNYKDLLILYAAGNDGSDSNRDGKVDPDSIGSPGTAKNALTVGATENERPNLSTTYGSGFSAFPVDPIFSDRVADQSGGMAGFSSRGPTDDGRVKPDLAAPGTFIISAYSHDPAASVSNSWGATSNPDYVYMGGTSMATPLTAGAAALVREWLTTVKGFAAPSAALMKAVLVNGSVDISPGQYSSPQEIPYQRPNNVSGWGRVSLVNSIAPPAPQTVYLEDNTSGLTTGGSATYSLNVGGASSAEAFVQVAQVEDTSSAVQVILEPKAETTPEPPLIHPSAVVTATRSTSQASVLKQNLEVEQGGADGNLQISDDVEQIIVNGGFEADENWLVSDTARSNAQSFNGSWSMASIPGVDGFFYQTVDIPSDVISADLEFYLKNINPDVDLDILQMAIFDHNTEELIGYGSILSYSDPNVWIGVTTYLTDIISIIRGKTIDLVFFIDQNDSEPHATFYIDDVALYISRPDATPPTPTEPAPTLPAPDGNPLRVTLAWTDYPGSTTASKVLVNDLDLEVIAPDGTHYYGNMGTYGSGNACLRDGKWDQCNNLEGVIIPGAAYGTYTIVVHGVNIPNGPQPFALAATGDQLGIDAIAPAKITDLHAETGSSSGAADLSWTAPGDDGLTGDPASAYVIKYNKSAITSANWSASTTVVDIPAPGPAGSAESVTVYGLKPGDTYYFAIKTLDEIPNVSAVSNSPSAQASTAPDTVPPAKITDLAAYPGLHIGDILLSWTAPGDDVRTGTAISYTLRMSTTEITAANWISATLVTDVPSPSLAGTREVLTLPNMPLKQTYYFAIKAQDEVPNISELSNIDSTVAEDRRKLFLPMTLR